MNNAISNNNVNAAQFITSQRAKPLLAILLVIAGLITIYDTVITVFGLTVNYQKIIGI